MSYVQDDPREHCGDDQDPFANVGGTDKFTGGPSCADCSPGGDSHYKQGGVEPIDFIMGNDLPHWKGNAIEYIFRAGKKDDEATDIRKAIWYCEQRLKQLEGED